MLLAVSKTKAKLYVNRSFAARPSRLWSARNHSIFLRVKLENSCSVSAIEYRDHIIVEYRDLLIVLPKREPSIFRGIALSLLRPVIGSNANKFPLHSNDCTNISIQVQQYLLKIRLSQLSSSSCIIGKHQYKWYVYTILLIAPYLYLN